MTTTTWRGRLLHIHVAPAESYEMEELAEATLVAGRGIEGDRYYLGAGTYSALPAMREITLIEVEVLEALARNDPPLQDGQAFPASPLFRLLGRLVTLPLLRALARLGYRAFARLRPYLPKRRSACSTGSCRLGRG